VRGHKAWTSPDKQNTAPTTEDLKTLFDRHPDTHIVTCTRRAASLVNEMALLALYANKQPLVVLPGDVEFNPLNYEGGHLKDGVTLQPLEVPIFRGMKLYLTKNVRKKDDYVNCMLAIVHQYYHNEKTLRVRTRTGHQLVITPWTDVNAGNAVYYPIRPGYASTVHKIQGDQLPHITIWLDIPGMNAAGYTALSRVQRGSDYLLGGYVKRHHFMPVNF